ncbi:phosphoglycerate mutase-like protein, partial [Sparassis latifolia]
IRHGESTDNLRSVWAGWKDSPLSNHGKHSHICPQQAKEMGKSLSHVRFAAIHTSPLKRALWTAEALRQVQSEPKPPLTTSLLLREQHWGIAEGKPWIMEFLPGVTLEQHYERGVYPVLHGRGQKFPEGESLDDLAARANVAIEEIIMPHIRAAARSGKKGIHVAIVSHGLCISEIILALLKRDGSGTVHERHYRGLLNTAWSRVTVDVDGAQDSEALEFSDEDTPILHMRVTEINRHEHLDNVEKRQKGGIGSSEYDPKQQDIRAFFGGGGTKAQPPEEGRSVSNARDEADEDLQ